MIQYQNNQTVKFILPLVVDITPNTLLRDDFLGAFIGDVERPEFDGCLLLAYRVPKTLEGLKYELIMTSPDNYMTSYDYVAEGIVIYVYNIEDEVADSVSNILDGNYSKIRPEDKLEICKFWHKRTGGNTMVDKILCDDNTDILEVWYSFGIDPETVCASGEYWYKPDFTKELFYIVE